MGGLVKRLVQSGINSGFKTKINLGISSLVSKQSPSDYSRLVNPNGKSMSRRNLSDFRNPNPKVVDKLALVRSLEAQGVSSKEAQEMTSILTKIRMIQDAPVSKFKCEAQSSDSEEPEFLKMLNETSKQIVYLENMNSKIDREFEELKVQLEAQKNDTKAKLVAVTDDLTSQIEAGMFEGVKYIGALVSLSALGFVVIRLVS